MLKFIEEQAAGGDQHGFPRFLTGASLLGRTVVHVRSPDRGDGHPPCIGLDLRPFRAPAYVAVPSTTFCTNSCI